MISKANPKILNNLDVLVLICEYVAFVLRFMEFCSEDDSPISNGLGIIKEYFV